MKAAERAGLETEYEQLLAGIIAEKKQKLDALGASGEKDGKKKADELRSEINYVQVELDRYRRGMTLFRTKDLPKVGRWGKPEASQQAEAPQ